MGSLGSANRLSVAEIEELPLREELTYRYWLLCHLLRPKKLLARNQLVPALELRRQEANDHDLPVLARRITHDLTELNTREDS